MKAFAAAALVLLAAAPASAALPVVTSIPDLGAIAKAIGGEDIELTNLAKGNQDPHYVDPRPSYILALNRADLLLLVGLELEASWIGPLLISSKNPRIQPGSNGYLEVATVIERLQVPTMRIDRTMGDIHPGGNPHFLIDPRRVRQIARAIKDRLVALDRTHTENYERRFDRFDHALAAFDAAERARFAALTPAERRIVGYHQSLIYLVDWLGLEQVATVEPRPGINPEPGHVAAVLKTMRETHTQVIVQEDFYQRGPSETLAKLAKAKLYVFSGGTKLDDGQAYLDRMKELTGGLHDALSSP